MKNFEIKNIESGRSMIEMLGVLAIIGVLSVGGIAGYSKAMQKYRINKTIEQVSQISQNIRTFFAPQRDFSGLTTVTSDGKKLIQKAKLVPDEMLELNADGSIKQINNAFGGTVTMNTVSEAFTTPSTGRADYNDSYYLYFSGIPQESCIDLLSQNWLNTANLYGISVNIEPIASGGSMNLKFAKGCSGFKGGACGPNCALACAGGSTYSLPVEVDKAIEFCGNTTNTIGFLFY